jgi:hypothetical protein
VNISGTDVRNGQTLSIHIERCQHARFYSEGDARQKQLTKTMDIEVDIHGNMYASQLSISGILYG